jgi:UDP-2,3-diacylglucosamine pyrophosphatase LpxH
MFLHVLRDYYLARGHTLILNGDIEELQRFRLPTILRQWAPVYETFEQFRERDRLLRLIGNHDMDLMHIQGHDFKPAEALRYEYKNNSIFVVHGHQTAARFVRYNRLVGMGLRYIANPLHISGFSVAHNSTKRFITERRAYEFASRTGVLTIMGHTHRPLFESMSKLDSLKFEIERLCRKYPKASQKKKHLIEETITSLKNELTRVREQENDRATIASLYNSNLLIPCTFNSGTVIGKRGMTCLEITGGRISLVHWFDDTRSQKYLEYANLKTKALAGTDYHRVKLKSESLDYIFTRIRLLARE